MWPFNSKGPRPPAKKLSVADCQMRLAVIWLLPGLVLFVLMMVQTFTGRIEKPEVGWEWLIPTILPSISVIVGGIIHAASATGNSFTINEDVYKLCKWLSWGYLSIVLLTLILAGPVATNKTPEEWLAISNLWITPLQAPVGIALGVFFASSRPEATAEPVAPGPGSPTV